MQGDQDEPGDDQQLKKEREEWKEEGGGNLKYSNVGRLFCTPAPPKFTKKLAVDSFFNFGS